MSTIHVDLGVFVTFLTTLNLFGQKPFISLKLKRSKAVTPDPRVMTEIKISPTNETFTHWTRTVTMVKDIFHLIPRTTVDLNFDWLGRKRFW